MTDDDSDLRVHLVTRLGELRALARRLVFDGDDDDVVQDTALAALVEPSPPARPAPWLREVLRNAIRGRARHRRAWTSRRFDPASPEPTETPERNAEAAELAALVLTTLAELEEPYRSTLRRRFFDDLAPADIARTDGEPTATVRWRVHEGLRRMRARLDEQCGGRERWCGALVVLFDLSVPARIGAAAMTTTSTSISMIIAGALLVGSLVALTRSDDADARAAASPPLGTPSSPTTAAPIVADEVLGGDHLGEDASCNPEPADAEAVGGAGSNVMTLVAGTVMSCLESAPTGSLDGLPRLEINVRYERPEDSEPAHIVRVDVTTGRKLPCSDGVLEETPVDAPGVVRHKEIEECVAASVEDTWLDSVEVDASTKQGVLGGVLPLDGKGNLATAVEPAWELPALPNDEKTPDPHAAVGMLQLPTKGSTTDDRLEIVECGGYACAFSHRSEAELDELRTRHPNLAISWLHFPLPNQEDGLLMATAAVAAARQDRFWEMHRALFDHPKPMRPADVVALARRVGLDVPRFERDVEDPAVAMEVARQRRVCEVAGVTGSPSFFVHSDLIRGAVGAEKIAKTIEELASSNE